MAKSDFASHFIWLCPSLEPRASSSELLRAASLEPRLRAGPAGARTPIWLALPTAGCRLWPDGDSLACQLGPAWPSSVRQLEPTSRDRPSWLLDWAPACARPICSQLGQSSGQPELAAPISRIPALPGLRCASSAGANRRPAPPTWPGLRVGGAAPAGAAAGPIKHLRRLSATRLRGRQRRAFASQAGSPTGGGSRVGPSRLSCNSRPDSNSESELELDFELEPVESSLVHSSRDCRAFPFGPARNKRTQNGPAASREQQQDNLNHQQQQPIAIMSVQINFTTSAQTSRRTPAAATSSQKSHLIEAKPKETRSKPKGLAGFAAAATLERSHAISMAPTKQQVEAPLPAPHNHHHHRHRHYYYHHHPHLVNQQRYQHRQPLFVAPLLLILIQFMSQQLASGIHLPQIPTGLIQQTAAANPNSTIYIYIQDKNQLIPFNSAQSNHAPNNHDPRIEIKYLQKNKQEQQSQKFPFVSLDEKAPNNTVVVGISASDEDGTPVSLAIEQGNELQHFKLVETKLTTTIQVNGAPLSRAQKADYNLTIVARDSGYPQRSSTANLVIKLNASSSHAPITQDFQGSKQVSNDYMHVGKMLVLIFFAFIGIIMAGCCLVRRPSNSKKPHSPSTQPTSTIHPHDHRYWMTNHLTEC